MDMGSEYGRLLAERDRLISQGVDAADLEVPLPPFDSRGMRSWTEADGTRVFEVQFTVAEEPDDDAFEDVRTDPVPVHDDDPKPEDDPSVDHEAPEED